MSEAPMTVAMERVAAVRAVAPPWVERTNERMGFGARLSPTTLPKPVERIANLPANYRASRTVLRNAR